MLAEKCDIKNVEESMKRGQVYYVETKHDGERFQLHMQDGIYKYFSRYVVVNSCTVIELIIIIIIPASVAAVSKESLFQ
uniref:ATP-dependent DNA ligase family profile domain-containing protein n=1 Tax=Timema cristinae TaxID=61476 RepID=A0A7R9DAY2_TIMCR|nr:unnamed protein product [Timema cristinae]